jgi:hypothetical protein
LAFHASYSWGVADYQPPIDSQGRFIDYCLLLWQVVDMISGLDNWKTLDISPPTQPHNVAAGIPILLFRAFVLYGCTEPSSNGGRGSGSAIDRQTFVAVGAVFEDKNGRSKYSCAVRKRSRDVRRFLACQRFACQIGLI